MTNDIGEEHYIHRSSWLRAAVLGANDGLLSTSSLLVGVAAASVNGNQLLVTGIAGLVAGAMSMAAGEYVSVSSQSDTERADTERERAALAAHPHQEQRELATIYIKRGLTKDLALQVAEALSAKGALDAHVRDELGITEAASAKPIQAALASAASFAIGGLPPLVAVLILPPSLISWGVVAVALVTLAILGAVGARTGGAPMAPGVVRVLFWGAVAMAVTFGIGHLFHTSVA